MKKKILLFLIVLIGSITSIFSTYAQAKTQSEAVNWAKTQANNGVMYSDSGNGGQCTDFVSAYMNYIVYNDAHYWKNSGGGGFRTYGAKDYFSQSYPSGWQKIANTPDFVPQPGDILCFGANAYNGYGHVAVAIEGCTVSIMKAVGQNGVANNYQGTPAQYQSLPYFKDWGNFQGVIRPNFYTAPTTYTISYNANGGSGAPGNQTKTHGTNLTLSSTKPTRAGYTFKNWNTSANGSGTAYSAGGVYSANSAVTLYAQWTVNNYTVSFNANGGNGAPGNQTKTHGTNLTLSSKKPTRTGYTFKNWNTSANGSGTAYSAGGVYSANSAVTLYAQWTANSYTVSLNANGGATSTATKSVTYNSTYGALPTPTRTGYTFKGWYTSASGGTQISSGTKVSIKANQTLYAQWNINSYILKIRPNGGIYTNGSGSYDSETTYTKTYGSSTVVGDVSRTGYQFVCWSIDGYGTLSPWGKTVLNTSPQFSDNKIPSTYNNKDNGTVKIESVAKEASCPTSSAYMMKITASGEAQPGLGGFASFAISKPGGVFYHTIIAKIPVGYSIADARNACGDGAKSQWLTSQKGTGKWETYMYKLTCGSVGTFGTFGHVYIHGIVPTDNNPIEWYVGYSNVTDATGINDNNIFTYSGNTIITAKWRANDYTIKYNANGGEGAMSDTACRYDDTYTLAKNAFTRKNYTFKGWNTKADGSGTAYGDGISVKNLTAENNGGIILYAQWERSVKISASLSKYASYSICSAVINGTAPTSTVIMALYKDGSLVSIETRPYTGVNEYFAVFQPFDTIKIMLWDNFDALQPITERAVIKK